MKLKLFTGHELTKNETPIDADRVRFVAPDGRTMFEVAAGKDGLSIQVRGVECTRADGVLRSEYLTIEPGCANTVTIRTRLYHESK